VHRRRRLLARIIHDSFLVVETDSTQWTPTSSGRVVRIDPKLGVVWKTIIDAPTTGIGVLAVGHLIDTGGLHRPCLNRLDGSGKLLWQRVDPACKHRSPLAVFGNDAERTILIGTASVEGANRMWTQLRDPAGIALGEQTYPLPNGSVSVATNRPAAQLPDGGYVVAGLGSAGGLQKLVIARTDPWGHATCAAAGVCKGKTEADCADTDACSTDYCDAEKGCVHQPTTCDDGEPCTVDACDKTSGCNWTPKVCDDGDACTTDTCEPQKGCVFTKKC
jgi:hypothetical protein